jgi:branched-subunit amino acid aminotransferase/4-amino-4-deoxychorismate lyase
MDKFDIRKYLGVFESFLLFPDSDSKKLPQIIAFSKHLNRFDFGSKKLGLKQFTRDEVTLALINRVKEIDLNKIYRVRITNLNSNLEINFDTYCPLEDKFIARLVTEKIERSLPEIKSTSIVASIYARDEAKKKNAYEALLLDRNDFIREGAWTNVFWLDSKLKWNTPQSLILNGICRELIFDYFRASKQASVLVKDTKFDEFIKDVQAVVITNSIHGAISVSHINEKCLEQLEFSQHLCSQFNQYRSIFLERL